MNDHAELPLQIDISNRRCRRIYLILAHLLPLLVLLISGIDLFSRIIALTILLLSGGYWWWREKRNKHPQTLEWDAALGWRLVTLQEKRNLSRPRHLLLGSCLLLQLDKELLFLPNRPGMNRLRRLLRGGK